MAEHSHDFRGAPARCSYPGCYEDPVKAIAERDALAARVEALEAVLDCADELKQHFRERAEALEAQRDEALRALEFYADPERYDYDVDCCYAGKSDGGVLNDEGQRAREALNESR